MRAGGFPGNPGGLVVSIVQTAGGRAPAHQAVRPRTEHLPSTGAKLAGARMVPLREGNEARGDGRRGVGVLLIVCKLGQRVAQESVQVPPVRV